MSTKVVYVLFLLCAYTSYISAHRNVRVMGGTLAELGQFPSIVSINIIFQDEAMHFCGGSIIDKQWVVTAAHCIPVIAKYDHFVRADSLASIDGGTTYNVSTIITHENFSADPHNYNDIALLKLDRAIVLSDTAQIIETGEAEGNESCTVVGWGTTDTTLFDALVYANLTALTEDDCARLAEGGDFDLERGPGQVCAFGGFGTSPCYGDSGGPLICDDKLAGIVSYAIKACAEGYPDVYTRTAYYVDWINTTISNN